MEHFINDLKLHNFQNRKYAIVENGSWAPQAGKLMEAAISEWKGMEKRGETVTVLSAVQDPAPLVALAKTLAEDFI